MLSIKRLGYALGAQVTGVDLRENLAEATIGEIRAALLEHIVLCFPSQELEQPTMRAFCSRFGKLDSLENTMTYDPNNPGVLIRDSKPFTYKGNQIAGSGVARMWHSDHSYSRRPNPMTFLSNYRVLPDVGGNTLFANTTMGYETLSPAYRAMIDPLLAIHDNSLGAGYAQGNAEQRLRMVTQSPPVVHPLVSTHPETGRKALYVDENIRTIVGMSEEEARPIIRYLIEHATRYEFTYRHVWTASDFIMWDNRCAMHVALQDFDRTQSRMMLRCSLEGEPTGILLRDFASEGAREPALNATG